MKAHLIDTHLLVPRSRSSAKVKVKYRGHVSQKMDVLGAFVFHKHILFKVENAAYLTVIFDVRIVFCCCFILQNDGHNIFKYLTSEDYKQVLIDVDIQQFNNLLF